MKRLALSLLLLMLAAYALSSLWMDRFPWLAWVRAFAEAASVGAIADWFAVTALFRHPLGLPIPHTAIIPRNRDKVGESLGRFVEENFLTPENLARRLKELNALGAAVEWLRAPANSRRLARSACEPIPGFLERLGNRDLETLLDRALLPQLQRLDVSALAGELLEVLTHDGRHQALLDRGLTAMDNWLDENRELVRRKFSEASALTSRFFDYYVVNRFVDGIQALLHEIATDPRHEVRRRFDAATISMVHDLRNSPEWAEKGRELLGILVLHLRTEAFYRKAWDDLRARISADIANPESQIVESVSDLLREVARVIQHDSALLGRLEASVLGGVERLLHRHRHEIARLISAVVMSWDGEEIATRVEQQVGRDLQYIRINGTFVGGTVGLLLHLFSQSFIF